MIPFELFFHKHYLDTFEDSMVSARFRPIFPAVYNPMRLNECPIPRFEFTIDTNNQDESSSTSNMNSTQGTDVASVEANAHDHEDLQSTWYDSGEFNNPDEVNNSTRTDIKPFTPVDGEDLVA